MSTLDNTLQHCKLNNIRITKLRKLILEHLCKIEKPITAYELLDRLIQCSAPQKRYNIMSVYRILNFLLDNGLIHKIDSNNTYSICCRPGINICQLFICQSCSGKIETHKASISHALAKVADHHNFTILSNKIEVLGLCQSCKI